MIEIKVPEKAMARKSLAPSVAQKFTEKLFLGGVILLERLKFCSRMRKKWLLSLSDSIY